ncbi:hypothetical protein RPPX_29005 (plasmid) [Pseudomonas putida S12]|uniref:Uncharacterized protein n=1 Tax=Pseudomonas putida S12 TaxID=1215087 RepID=A0AA34S1C1_PSEPU|nr:hypothetical protein RPPX_09620 [Pseudomonas putida S12]AJA17361.1 hypothetical protein RPPX_29005 [Pseudomonas putida S12]
MRSILNSSAQLDGPVFVIDPTFGQQRIIIDSDDIHITIAVFTHGEFGFEITGGFRDFPLIEVMRIASVHRAILHNHQPITVITGARAKLHMKNPASHTE